MELQGIVRGLLGCGLLCASLTASPGPLRVIESAARQPVPQGVSEPDFDGDGRADYFSIRRAGHAGKADAAASWTCVDVALSRNAGEWTQRSAYCSVWNVSTVAAPDRNAIPGRAAWVARLSPGLFIPDVGYLPSSRDGVLLRTDSELGLLFFSGSQYVLHRGVDLRQVIHQEALEAFRKFEQHP